MGDTRRILQQWIETDAALGAVDLPVPRRRRGAVRKVAAPVTVAAPVVKDFAAMPKAPAVAVGMAPARAVVAPRPTTQPALIPTERGAPVARRKVDMPAAPAGDIGAMPVLGREAKLARLATLQAAAHELLTPLLNDVATKVVFGEGDVDAPVLFVGEGPGIEEDKTGRPFVGKSGQMLDKWIAAMGFKREGIYIANVVKLRAADWDEATSRLKDRPPTPEEVARSIHILHEQIEIIRPRAIVTLGAPAVKWLTGTTEGVMKIRGTWMAFRGIPLMPTYHPAFVLRAYTTENRGKVWSDLQAVMAKVKM